MNTRLESYNERLERTVLNPLSQTTKGYYIFVFFLLAVVIWGLYAYIIQLYYGLRTTGMSDVIVWGIYMVNFVFFIGIGHAGTFVSAVLRVTNVGWRAPITRMAELVTAFSLMMGALMPIIDMGRPERILNIFWFGRLQSPLLWDITAIITYLTGSIIYLYLPLIPDFALLRDRLGEGASAFKQKAYTFLAVGWHNTPQQRHRLEKAISIMAITIIPVMITVHTVVAFVFSMTLRPGWDSTIFGIYFVVGALYSGLATVLVIMAIFRKFFHLEEYLTERHFRNLSHLLLVGLVFYVYLTISEYITLGYKMTGEHGHLLETLFLGENALWFWFFWIAGILIPFFLIVFRLGRTIPRIITASVLINVAMWIKRFIILIPSLEIPMMPFEFSKYSASWVEWSITAGAFAMFILLYAIAIKFVPIISIWEMTEESKEAVLPEAAEEVEKV